MRESQYTKEQLATSLKDLNISLGRLPTKKDIINSYCVSYSTLLKVFGGLVKAYSYSGIEVPKWHNIDKNKLINLHVNDNLSVNALSELTGRSKCHIQKILGKNLIDQRNSIAINDKQHDIIEGLLISDGYLGDRTNVAAAFYLGQKIDKINFVKHIAMELGLQYSIFEIYPKDTWKSKATPEARYRSRSYPIFKKYNSRWYINGKKKVPRDFLITPSSLLYWYIGDGNIHNKSNSIRLSTCSFDIDDIEFLISSLNKQGFLCYRSSRNEIYLNAQSSKNFLEYIGKPPVDCYAYKWTFIEKEHRLTEVHKQEIIKKFLEGSKVSDLSKEYGFTKSAIYRLLRLNKFKIKIL